MADLVDLLDADERAVFDDPQKSFEDHSKLDEVIIKWLSMDGRGADIATMRLFQYLTRASGGRTITGREFLEWVDTNSLAEGASAEGQARIADLRSSEQYQSEDIKAGEFSSLTSTWRKELDQKRFDLWGEWWDAWKALREKHGIGQATPSGTPQRASQTGGSGAQPERIPRHGFAGEHAWVNSLDDRQWAAFSGEQSDGLDHKECLRTWSTATNNQEVLDALNLYEYLFSLARLDSQIGGAEFLAWYDGGWSNQADRETQKRVEALRQANLTVEANPRDVGSAVHPWREMLDDQLHEWNGKWWEAWRKAQDAGGYTAEDVKIDDDYTDTDTDTYTDAGYIDPDLKSDQDPDEAGQIVEAYASDNALDRLFEYLNQSDISAVMESIERVDRGEALDKVALQYPTEFVGWFDARASEEVQQALLARPKIAGVVRTVRSVADQPSPQAVELTEEDYSAIDRVNREAIRSIERGGEANWLAGGTAILIGDGHDRRHFDYHDAQQDRVGGRVIVRRVRVGTGPVVFFNVPPAKQQLVESAARRATRRRPVFENE